MPSEDEQSILSRLVHNNADAIKSTYGWNNDKNGYDILGLNILPAGSYTQIKIHGLMWANRPVFGQHFNQL